MGHYKGSSLEIDGESKKMDNLSLVELLYSANGKIENYITSIRFNLSEINDLI